MKNFIVTAILISTSSWLGSMMMFVAILCDCSDKVCIFTLFAGGIVSAMLLGVFNVPERNNGKQSEIKENDRYEHAA